MKYEIWNMHPVLVHGFPSLLYWCLNEQPINVLSVSWYRSEYLSLVEVSQGFPGFVVRSMKWIISSEMLQLLSELLKKLAEEMIYCMAFHKRESFLMVLFTKGLEALKIIFLLNLCPSNNRCHFQENLAFELGPSNMVVIFAVLFFRLCQMHWLKMAILV